MGAMTTPTLLPGAVQLAASGALAARAATLHARLAACDLCPQACGVNRLAGDTGRCRTGAAVHLASACDHHGEEPAISGRGGSGTIFVAGCNLQCVFCQNAQISQGDLTAYHASTADSLAEAFLDLQRRGCENINWVSPSHVVPQLVSALARAVAQGLCLPLVYNSNGYDRLSTLALLDGVVDIYLPDLKYADAATGHALSGAPDYPETALAAIAEMYRQVGDLAVDAHGVARRGVIVRHLVLPAGLAGTRRALQRLADEVSPTITVSLMAQYYPAHRAHTVPALTRTITAAEYEDALDAFVDAGLKNGWSQELHEAPESYQPDFTHEHPFARG